MLATGAAPLLPDLPGLHDGPYLTNDSVRGLTRSSRALAIRTGAFTGRRAQTVHAYPTWSTGIRSAAAQFFVEIDGRVARPAKRG